MTRFSLGGKVGVPVVLPTISADWTTYTPTIVGITPSTLAAWWVQVGPNMTIRGSVRATAVGTGVAVTFSIPTGYTIKQGDFTYTFATSEPRNNVGSGVMSVTGTDQRNINVYPVSTTQLGFSIPTKLSLLGTDVATSADIDFVVTIPLDQFVTTAYTAYGAGAATSVKSGLVAPRKGQFQMTVTSTVSGWATIRSSGIYYQDQDGAHRLKYNFSGTCTAATLTGGDFTLTGVVFKNVTGHFQACSAFTNGSNSIQSYANPGLATVTIAHASGAGTSRYTSSGDVELDSKPTWA